MLHFGDTLLWKRLLEYEGTEYSESLPDRHHGRKFLFTVQFISIFYAV
jgi:hypothetical protein